MGREATEIHESGCTCGNCVAFRAGIPGARRGYGPDPDYEQLNEPTVPTQLQIYARRIADLEALLREGRGQSYGVMGIGTHKLIALQEWFAKVDAALSSTHSNGEKHE